jgi:hypothetical protein
MIIWLILDSFASTASESLSTGELSDGNILCRLLLSSISIKKNYILEQNV